MRRKERPFSDSPGENRGRVNDLVQLGDQAAGANVDRGSTEVSNRHPPHQDRA
jgi:hypothetical protein